MDTGFVRYTHRRCEDCDIREDLHASGSPLPKRRHHIARCKTCGGRGEIPLDLKSGLDPYRAKVPQGRAQFYEAKRQKRAHAERHRFRARTYLGEEIESLMEQPPGGFNFGREFVNGKWQDLSTELHQALAAGLTLEHLPQRQPPQLRPFDTRRHGTFGAYNNQACRCAACRRAATEYRRASRLAKAA